MSAYYSLALAFLCFCQLCDKAESQAQQTPTAPLGKVYVTFKNVGAPKLILAMSPEMIADNKQHPPHHIRWPKGSYMGTPQWLELDVMDLDAAGKLILFRSGHQAHVRVDNGDGVKPNAWFTIDKNGSISCEGASVPPICQWV